MKIIKCYIPLVLIVCFSLAFKAKVNALQEFIYKKEGLSSILQYDYSERLVLTDSSSKIIEETYHNLGFKEKRATKPSEMFIDIFKLLQGIKAPSIDKIDSKILIVSWSFKSDNDVYTVTIKCSHYESEQYLISDCKIPEEVIALISCMKKETKSYLSLAPFKPEITNLLSHSK